MSTPANALDISTVGIVKFDGVNAFTTTTITQFDTLVGGASNAITSIATGTSGQVLTSNGAGVDPSYQNASGSTASLSPYIVGTTGTSDFATIQGAITQAVADGASNAAQKNIYVKPGTYNENITLSDGINVIGFDSCASYDSAQFTTAFPSVNMTGTVTANGGHSKIKNIHVSPGNNATFLHFSASTDEVLVQGCTITLAGASSIFVNFDQAAAITIDHCQIPAGIGQGFTVASGISPSLTFSDSNILFGSTSSATAGAGDMNFYMNGSNLFGALDATNFNTFSFFSDDSLHNVSTGELLTFGATASAATYQNSSYFSTTTPFFSGSNTDGFFKFINSNCQNGPTGSIGEVSGAIPVFRQFVACPIRGTGADASYTNVLLNGMLNFSFGTTDFDWIISQGAVTTANNTATNVASIVVDEDQVITLKGFVVGNQDDFSDACGGDYLITARRASGGNVTLIGSAIVNVNSSSTATFTADVDTGTQTVRVRVTGITAETWNWSTCLQYQKRNVFP